MMAFIPGWKRPLKKNTSNSNIFRIYKSTLTETTFYGTPIITNPLLRMKRIISCTYFLLELAKPLNYSVNIENEVKTLTLL